ncbi:hypothetical protein COO60DRAFT_1592344 [Scenedesmus sp. NREL 46B-D3]|nr:hypothetical protein COO60DRAFT_1592344 [Scenedesmus sp. NREL 46B-D3]
MHAQLRCRHIRSAWRLSQRQGVTKKDRQLSMTHRQAHAHTGSADCSKIGRTAHCLHSHTLEATCIGEHASLVQDASAAHSEAHLRLGATAIPWKCSVTKHTVTSYLRNQHVSDQDVHLATCKLNYTNASRHTSFEATLQFIMLGNITLGLRTFHACMATADCMTEGKTGPCKGMCPVRVHPFHNQLALDDCSNTNHSVVSCSAVSPIHPLQK